jgi:hypothetical protein
VSTTPTTRDTNAHDDRATRIERRLVRAILTTRAACTAATVAGWYPSDGDTALHLMRLGGMAHVALKGLAGVPTCPACDEPYGYHPPSCALAPYLRAAVERVLGASALCSASTVLRERAGFHPRGSAGAYLVCAPSLDAASDVVAHTALLVGFVDLDVLPSDTLAWPIVLPIPASLEPPAIAEAEGTAPDDVARFVAAYRADPVDVFARLSRNPLRPLRWTP